MQQSRNLNRVMESGNHFKNGVSLKNYTSKENLKFFTIIALMTVALFTSCSNPNEPGNNEITGIELNATSLSLGVGQSQTLTATIFPTDATDKSVAWISSNTSVASVKNGVVTANAQGTATITATAGNQTATCKVTVSELVVAVTSVTLDNTTLTLAKGGTYTLTATVKPDNATNKTVTWTSSDVNKITVDNNGKVTAKDIGQATITATAGGKSATCTVSVSETVGSITLDCTYSCILNSNNQYSKILITPTVSPSNTSVTWTSSNTSVATVYNYSTSLFDDNNKGMVAAVVNAKGTTTITAKAGDKTATCTITVGPIVLYKDTLDLIPGEQYTLGAETNPYGQPITWNSGFPNVTVDGNYGTAKVIAIAPGLPGTINATYSGQTVSCTVIVNDCFSQEYVTFDGIKWATRNVDKPGTFAAKASDAGMFYQWNRKIGWSSTNPMVNSNGGTEWDGSTPAGNSWETANDPCPTGWRVPTNDEANKLLRAISGTRVNTSVNGIQGDKFGAGNNTIFWPDAGMRWADRGYLSNSIETGHFWTSLPNTAEGAYSFGGVSSFDYRASALSVRCVKK